MLSSVALWLFDFSMGRLHLFYSGELLSVGLTICQKCLNARIKARSDNSCAVVPTIEK